MRILVAHHVPRARTGGMSRLMGCLHDRVERAGATVDYFCADDVRVPGAAARHAFPLLAWRHAVSKYRAGSGYDVINVHEPAAAPIAAWRTHGAAVVVTSHGVEQRGWEVALAEGAAGYRRPRLLTRVVYPATSLWQSRAALVRADRVFCLSEQDRSYLADRMHVPAAAITRIVPAADPLFGRAAENRDYTRDRTILFAGTWVPRKGIADLVAAFGALHRGSGRPSLVVLGAGVPETAVLSSFSPELRPFVRAVSAADDAATAQVFADADVFVLPSVFEGTPLTLIEAMMSGLPVVTTATSGMPDVVADGHTGVLIDVHAPVALARIVQRLLQTPAEREALGRAAHRRAVERHSWDAVSRPVVAVYEDLVARRSSA